MLFWVETLSVRSFAIDGDQFLMDGQPFTYVSGSFHYWREIPERWKDILEKMVNLGMNAVQTYVPWNLHEPEKGTYHFDYDLDVVNFIQIAQSLGLYVILRPGPYICGEMDFGGLPAWLMLADSGVLRSSDPRFMKHVNDWYGVLYPRLANLTYARGGPIIMVQIENEYGSHDCDRKYLNQLADLAESYFGKEQVLFTVDPPPYGVCGSIPDRALATIDFGTDKKAIEMFAEEKSWNNNRPVPRVNTEWYAGWFSWWGDAFAGIDTAACVESLDQQLALGASINFYMAFGGTNRRRTEGSQGSALLPLFQPVTSSYDYDAPISEAGDLTSKYWTLRAVIKRYRNVVDRDVSNTTKISVPKVQFTECVPLLDDSVLGLVVTTMQNAEAPASFESLGVWRGYVMYCSTPPDEGLFEAKIYDRAVMVEEHAITNVFVRPSVARGLVGPHRVHFLVESLGRLNFGWDEEYELRGFHGTPKIDGKDWTNWTSHAIPLETVDFSQFPWRSELTIGEPMFYRATFRIDEVGDTFLNCGGLGRGEAWVNGHSVERYWASAGAQMTLLVRGQFLKRGVNELVIFETGRIDTLPVVSLDDHPTLNGPVGTRDS